MWPTIPRLLALSFIWCSAACALEFAPAFSDHMVLQAGRVIPLSGRARPGGTVAVTLAGRSQTATADAAGRWAVDWPALPATRTESGETLTLTSGGEQAVIHDVLIGEVWLCSGQSNMRFALGRNYVQPDPHSPRLFPGEIAAAHHPRLRLLSVSSSSPVDPRTPAGRRWAECTPETAVGFSAIGYFFGRDLLAALADEPVGLIDLGKGGEPIRGFVSRPTIAANAALRASVPPLAPNHADPTGEVFEKDLTWLAPFAVRGVLWYQGESEVSRAKDYPAWMTALIAEWRATLASPNAAFLLVQLPVYERHRTDPVPAHPGIHWAELRAAQVQVADTLPGVMLTPALELGEQFEIHPHRKVELGRRLAALAERHIYGLAVPADAPRLAKAIREGSTCVLTFSGAEGGIIGAADRLGNFECGAADGRFVPAEARITGNDMVTVTIPAGFDATTVRYGWRDYFRPDLFNGESLPVIPFSVGLAN